MLVISLSLNKLLRWVTLDSFTLERQEGDFFSSKLISLGYLVPTLFLSTSVILRTPHFTHHGSAHPGNLGAELKTAGVRRPRGLPRIELP